MSPSPAPERPDVASAVRTFSDLRTQRARADADEIRMLASVQALVEGHHGPLDGSSSADVAYRSVIAELATATRTAERTVRGWVEDAADLVRRFEPLVVALESARLSRAHVAVIHEFGATIPDDEVRERFVERMVAHAADLTPGRLRAVARIAAERARADTLAERHQTACRGRRIGLLDLPDGMSELTMLLPSVLAHAIYGRATGFALRSRDRVAGAEDSGEGSGDARTMDERRADVVTDLLLTGTPTTCAREDAEALRASVSVTVPVLTLLGESDEPAVLNGAVPIDPGTARRLAGAASGWDRVLTHPVTGVVLAVDRYTPSEGMRRHLRARDERCRFPGCRAAAARCDVDHTVDAAQGGPTAIANLAHLCRHHHTLKHATAWSVRQEADGTLRWTSPVGRVHPDEPPARVRFIARVDIDEGGPPPF